MLLSVFVTGFLLTAVRSQDCNWIRTLDCDSYKSDPLCGSNYVTYDSRCLFAKFHCIHPKVNILAETTCTRAGFTERTTKSTTTPPPPTAPITVKNTTPPAPVTTRTMATTTTHKPVFLGHDLVFDFFCLELSHEKCPDNTEPVCGSDGILYDNFCEFEKQRCSHRNLTPDHFNAC